MTGRRGMVAGVFVLLILALALATAALSKANGVLQWGGSVAFTFGVFGSFAIVGALILVKQPRNVIGRLFVAIGFIWTSGDFLAEYAVYGYVTNPGAVPFPIVGTWYGEWYWFAFVMLAFSLLPQVFPTGRPLPKRWTFFYRCVLLFTGAMILAATFEEHLALAGRDEVIRNPWGVPGHEDIEEGAFGPILLIGSAICIFGGMTSIFVRFRRSRGEERLQLKWFTLAVAFLVVQFVVQGALGGEGGHPYPALDGLALAMVPIAAFIAISRHRLYEIDVVINRALVYAVLTALLATAYVAGVALFRAIIPVGGGDLGVAVSTLVVAGLFAPVRRRVQTTIDQLFYRRRYDAAATLEEFSGGLRDQVELESLNRELIGVVTRTMQPSSVSLWLRSGETS